MLSPGSLVDERYLLRGPIGAGGMAQVHAAWDTRLQVPVALKVLSVPVAPIAARLVQEGRIQAALRHPNVVQVSDIVTVEGAPGLVMELVEGPSLAGLMDAHELDLVEAEHLARGVLQGVGAAHALGLVHRDLKPANVLLARQGETLVPKVADFGLARLLEGEGQGTRSGVAMGTPRYMAPEQIRGAKDVDQRADIFSLGALFYELFLGRVAFEGEDTVALFNAVCTGDFRPPGELRSLPGHLERMLLSCLEIDAHARPADVAAVLALLGSAPPEAWRPETLAAHRRLAEAPPEQSPTAGSPTFSFSLAQAAAAPASEDTFDWSATSASSASSASSVSSASSASSASVDSVESPSDMATSTPAPPASQAVDPAPRGGLRRGLLLGLLVGGLGLAVLGGKVVGLWGSPAPAPMAFTPVAAPRLHGTPDQQRLLDQAWAEYQANEDLDAMGHLDEALAQGVSHPALHLLRGAVALGFGGWEVFEQQVAAGVGSAGEAPGQVPDLLRALHAGLQTDSDLSWWGPALRAHTQTYPEDWIAWVLWCVGMFAAPDQVPYEDAVVQAVMDTNPDAVGSWVVALELRRANGHLDRALAVGGKGLERHPGSAALRGVYALALIDDGELDAAMEQVQQCLRRDPAWSPCRTTGAGLAVRAGDDAALERLALPMTGPEADPVQASQLFHGVAQALELHGRPGAAERWWERSVAAALRGDDATSALQVRSARVRLALSPLRASDAELALRLRALDRALADPDLPRRARQEPGRTSQLTHALLQLRGGEDEAARELLPELDGQQELRLRWELGAHDAPAQPPASGDCGLLVEWSLGRSDAGELLTEDAMAGVEEACSGRSSDELGPWLALQEGLGRQTSPSFSEAWPGAEESVPIVGWWLGRTGG